MTTPLKLIEDMENILSNENNWTQGANGRDESGNTTTSLSDRACCWCLYGAFTKASYGIYPTHVQDVVLSVLDVMATSSHTNGIVAWNDFPDRTYDEVRGFLSRCKEQPEIANA